jgi:hypothetical protein
MKPLEIPQTDQRFGISVWNNDLSWFYICKFTTFIKRRRGADFRNVLDGSCHAIHCESLPPSPECSCGWQYSSSAWSSWKLRKLTRNSESACEIMIYHGLIYLDSQLSLNDGGRRTFIMYWVVTIHCEGWPPSPVNSALPSSQCPGRYQAKLHDSQAAR